MEKQDCWMRFSEALEMYLLARERADDAPVDSYRYTEAVDAMKIAADHMDALTR